MTLSLNKNFLALQACFEKNAKKINFSTFDQHFSNFRTETLVK